MHIPILVKELAADKSAATILTMLLGRNVHFCDIPPAIYVAKKGERLWQSTQTTSMK